MTRVVELRTGARLHFGLFGTKSDRGRIGGIGVMIDRPGFVLRGHVSDRDMIEGDPLAAERLRHWMWELAKPRTLWAERTGVAAAGVHISVDDSIPAHHGFGSGTQLALALASLLEALSVASIPDRAAAFGRGRRSLVGTLGFDSGGFILDAGEIQAKCFESRIALHDVPSEWRFVIVDPAAGGTWSGSVESTAFREAPPMSAMLGDRLGGLAVAEILPGLGRRDFGRFAAGVAEFNRLVGEHFSPVQGGVYAHPLIRELSRTLAGTDWPHFAQSSWGPAAAVFCESDTSAQTLKAFLERRYPPGAAHIFIASSRNQGAEVVYMETDVDPSLFGERGTQL